MTLKEIIATLEPLTKDFEPAYLYWVNASPSIEKDNDIRLAGTADSGEVYCEDCAEEEVERMEALDPDGEYLTVGGQCYEALSDGFDFCSKCDCLLDITLTDEGVRLGLEGFQYWVGNLHDDAQACYEFLTVCEAIEQMEDADEKATLTTLAMATYHRMQQMMDLYWTVCPTEGLKVWVGLCEKMELCVHVEPPYPKEERPMKDCIFINEVVRVFGLEYQQWSFKNCYPHLIEPQEYRLSEIKGVGQPSNEPLTHQEFLVALACFALADGRPGVPFSSGDIIPFLDATGLNTMSEEKAKEIGDELIRNEGYRQAMVEKMRFKQTALKKKSGN